MIAYKLDDLKNFCFGNKGIEEHRLTQLEQ